MTVPTPPRNLREQGQALWDSVIPEYTLKPDEIQALIDACRERDLIERLYEELEDGGTVTRGSMGQEVASAQLSEIRQHRALLNALMKSLKLPESGASESRKKAHVSEQARKAARARWGNTA
jgi:hypothetical protein